MASSTSTSAKRGASPKLPSSAQPQPAVAVEPWRVYRLPNPRVGKGRSPLGDASLRGSILHLQKHFNDRALRHPAFVYDTYEDEHGELIARCLQMTSFKGEPVYEKYRSTPGAWWMRLQYVPIQHYDANTGARTEPVHNMPILTTEGGKMMDVQSYIHLDHYFEIEAKHLSSFDSPCGGSVKLDLASRGVLMHKLRTFLSEGIRRNKRCLSRSPMDLCPSGIPQIDRDDNLRALADAGQREELQRTSSLPGGEITGNERGRRGQPEPRSMNRDSGYASISPQAPAWRPTFSAWNPPTGPSADRSNRSASQNGPYGPGSWRRASPRSRSPLSGPDA